MPPSSVLLLLLLLPLLLLLLGLLLCSALFVLSSKAMCHLKLTEDDPMGPMHSVEGKYTYDQFLNDPMWPFADAGGNKARLYSTPRFKVCMHRFPTHPVPFAV